MLLYRLLPALAIGVAALTIAITLGQALLGHGPAKAAAPAVSGVASPAVTVEQARATIDTIPTAIDTPAPLPATAVPAIGFTAPVRSTSSPLPSPPATPLPPATMDLTSIGGRVRAQGRILAPAELADYWFLIHEPERVGVFRQGPASVDAQGAFTFDLVLQPLNLGPDSVTLAAIPKDLSTAWTQETRRAGRWLPVIEVKAENGVTFLSEVSL